MRIFRLLIIFTIIGFITSCEDNATLEEVEYESTGTIMGYDLTLCACCGGWILMIDNDPNTYRFEELPEDSGLELDRNPLSVQFNWSINRECGSYIYLDIEEIELN